jgi:hypothetical protein
MQYHGGCNYYGWSAHLHNELDLKRNNLGRPGQYVSLGLDPGHPGHAKNGNWSELTVTSESLPLISSCPPGMEG